MPWKSLGIAQENQAVPTQTEPTSADVQSLTSSQKPSIAGNWKSLGVQGAQQKELETPETWGQWGGRNTARTAEKVLVEAPLETAEGIGSLAKAFNPLDKLMKAIGTTQLTPEQLSELKERVNKYNINVPGVSPPVISSKGVKEGLKKIAGDYFEPHGELEESWDSAVKNASTALYGSELTAAKLGRSLAGGLVGEAGSKAIEKLAPKGVASDIAKETAKMGSMLLAHSLNPGGAKKLGGEYYKAAEKSLPKGAIGDAYELEKELEGMIDNWKKGDSTWAKNQALPRAEKLLSKIRDGTLEFDDAWQFKKDLNTNSAELYKQQGATSSAVRSAKEHLGQVRSSVKNFLAKSEEHYPEFYQNMVKGDEIHSAIENSKVISNWIKKKFPMLENDVLSKSLFLAGESALTGFNPLAGGIGAGVVAGNEARALISQMHKSPLLRKYYLDTAKNALAQNSAGFLNSYNRLKKEYKKSIEFKPKQEK